MQLPYYSIHSTLKFMCLTLGNTSHPKYQVNSIHINLADKTRLILIDKKTNMLATNLPNSYTPSGNGK